MRPPQHLHASHFRGISLLESLIAMILLASGILMISIMQSRNIADLRTTVNRPVAAGLIDDITQRMRLNREATTVNIIGNDVTLSATPFPYTLDWDQSIPLGTDCGASECSPAELAQYDLHTWSRSVSERLPGGKAKIFQSSTDARQIGIVIAWKSVESNSSKDALFLKPLGITASEHGVDCPSAYLCHLIMVQP